MGDVSAVVFRCLQEIVWYNEPNMCRYMIYVGPMNYRSSEIDEVFVAHALPAHALSTTRIQFPIAVKSF